MAKCKEVLEPIKRRVKCLICKEKIPFDREKPDLIVNHVRMFHPNLEIAGLMHTSSPESLYQCSSVESSFSQNDLSLSRKNSNLSDTNSRGLKKVTTNEFNVPYNRVRLSEENGMANNADYDNTARCMLCKMSLRYDKSEPENLVNHVKLFHPYLKVAGMTTNNTSATNQEETKTSQKVKNASKFEKSVSAWQLEIGEILCKRCGTKGIPEKRNPKHNPDGISACFKQWCWIFALFMSSRNDLVDLFCVACKSYLGTYNSTTKLIKRLASRGYNQLPLPKLYGSYSAPNVAIKHSHNDLEILK